jgi:glutamyl-tRNA synthetase
VRVEDLDPATRQPDVARRQLDDLERLGLGWDGEPQWQSDRLDAHNVAIEQLTARGLTYPCWCSRAEIRAATLAPHGLQLSDGATLPDGAYPGTCADLDTPGRARRAEQTGRPPALRLRAEAVRVTVIDKAAGEFTGIVDDLVLRRADGVPAYNLAVVVDDAAAGVTEVVRGSDLLSSTPRQAHLADLLGLTRPSWLHVPLVVGPDGIRLAKRHGAVTLAELVDAGWTPERVCGLLASSLGLAASAEPVRPATLVEHLNPETLIASLPTTEWVVDPAAFS